MAKRAPVGEEPYRPLLDAGVISAALTKPNLSVPESAKREGSFSVVDIPLQRRELPSERSSTKLPVEDVSKRRTVPEDLVEKLDQEKRMLLTRAESLALDRLVGSLASRLNTQVKMSHVLRSLVTLLLNAEHEIDRRAGDKVGLMRPANGDFRAIQLFEREIAKVIAAALRDSGPLRDG